MYRYQAYQQISGCRTDGAQSLKLTFLLVPTPEQQLPSKRFSNDVEYIARSEKHQMEATLNMLVYVAH